MGSVRSLPLALALAALGLTACSNPQSGMGGGGNHSVCLPFPAATATTAAATTTTANGQAAPPMAAPPAGDPASGLEDCLHRWGYALATSSDDANQVASAAVAACGPAISRWNQSALTPGDGGGDPISAPSLVTGRETNPITEHYVFAQGRALFYVVQARAGKCAAPPMTNGVPTGLTY
jgi:hypothetical protein